MPGRDELIQQNTNRVRASSQAPKPQESAGKTPSGLSAPRSFFGGNYDVYSKLDAVEFQGSLGDNSLRGNVAYIQLWKRQPSKQQSASVPESVVAEIPDSTKQLQEDLEAAIETRDQVANSFDPKTQKYGYNPYGAAVDPEEDNLIEIAEARIQTIENQINQEKQKALSTQTPTSSTSTQSPNTTVTPPTTPASKNTTPVGTVKSANPGALTRAGKALIGVGPNRTAHPYSGSAANGGGLASSVSDDAKWQFLFNPSELELEVGPEFKGAETWGVSDKGNSGQPLHWSHNQNAKLKFNSVLLNGYVFGRKVEALEQGLIELFMARDGDGQHGPHILEFVWGKRVFGPCVIRNVNIKEKMWDEGEVVNAEVSFTLEQVPEWTINDGFVDVARPGRLGVIGDPTTPGSSAENPGGAKDGGEQPPPGGGAGSPGQKPAKTPQTVVDQCKAIISDQKYIQTFITDVSSKLEGIEGLVYGPFGILRTDNTSVFRKNADNYRKIFGVYSRNSLYKSSMTAGTLGANCVDISPIVYSWTNSGNALVRQKDKVANQQLLICYKNIKSVMDKKAKEGKCSNLATPTGGKSGPGLF